MSTDLEKPFKISIEHFDEKVTVERPCSNVTIRELIQMFLSVSEGAGFSRNALEKELYVESNEE